MILINILKRLQKKDSIDTIKCAVNKVLESQKISFSGIYDEFVRIKTHLFNQPIGIFKD